MVSVIAWRDIDIIDHRRTSLNDLYSISWRDSSVVYEAYSTFIAEGGSKFSRTELTGAGALEAESVLERFAPGTG